MSWRKWIGRKTGHTLTDGFIENITKEFVINKEMTSKQRDILCQRYRGG